MRSNCLEFISKLLVDEKCPLVVIIKPLTRTLEQNAKMHAMLTDIAKQMTFNGKSLHMLQWKGMLVCAFNKAAYDEEPEIVEFEGIFYNLRESTAEMGIKRTAEFIEYLFAWGEDNGVRFSDSRNYFGW